MGIRQAIAKYISSHTETSEQHFDSQFQTHYYKTMKPKIIKEMTTIIERTPGYEIKKIHEDRGEMIVTITKPKKALMIMTVITVKPLRTAVDFSVATETAFPSDFGYSRKVISQMYEELTKRFEYIGSGIGEQIL